MRCSVSIFKYVCVYVTVNVLDANIFLSSLFRILHCSYSQLFHTQGMLINRRCLRNYLHSSSFTVISVVLGETQMEGREINLLS